MRCLRLSSNFGTAIHMLLIIHEETKKQKVTSDIVAEILGTSPVSARGLLLILKKAGFITIAPRKEKEGTRLAKPLNEITLFDIFDTVEPGHVSKFIDLNTKRSTNTYTGQHINDIISGYVEVALDGVKERLSNITLADALAALESKELECEHGKTRFSFIEARTEGHKNNS